MDEPRDAWTDRLSEYVDGELDAAERAALDVHLQVCPACARTVTELRAVLKRAGELEAPPPAEDLWPGIAARLAAPPAARARVPGAGSWRGRVAGAARRRWSFTLPQLAAAAAALVLVSSLGAWAALSRRPAGPASGAAVRGPGPDTVEPAAFEPARYDAAIAELEQVLRERRGELDPATVRAIEENLLVIDEATAQARQALAADPASPYLNGHLATQLKRKLTLLRQATAVIAAQGG